MCIRVTAEEFLKAFLAAYKCSRSQLDDTAREEVRPQNPGRWNGFMLGNDPGPPSPMTESVLHQAARALGLLASRRNEQPLYLDRVFYGEDAEVIGCLPFPILVAVEHENDYLSFDCEIAKLLSVRSQLKVGITYKFGEGAEDAGQRQEVLDLVEGWVCRLSCAISRRVAEDPRTEYLFIVGTEEPERSLSWQEMHFCAGAADGIGRGFASTEP